MKAWNILHLNTYPASLLYQPGVELLSDHLENPANNCSDVLKMVGGQCLQSKHQINHISPQDVFESFILDSRTVLGPHIRDDVIIYGIMIIS